MKYIIVVILILVLSPVSWVILQKKIDARVGEDKKIENLVYIPSGRFLSVMAMGYRDVAADFLWMKTSIYFGTHFQTDQNYSWIYRLIESITDLDPTFHQPYMFGGIALASEVGNIDQSDAILYKAWQNIPNNWQYPFYIGFNNFFYRQNYIKSANLLKAASELEGSPPYLKGMYAELLMKGNSPLVGKTFLAQTIEHIGNEDIRKKFIEKINKYDYTVPADTTADN